MLKKLNPLDLQSETLIGLIEERARNLFLTRQLLCAEAVLMTLNQGFNGGLSDAQAISLAAPFSMALGESGCICGALSGGVLACGLLLGNGKPAHAHRKDIRECARQLHDAFKTAHGATCCRVLSAKVKHDAHTHFEQCATLTAYAAKLTARVVLGKRPDLLSNADRTFLTKRDNVLAGIIHRLSRCFSIQSFI